jgi:superfamily II DNA or RNA helicase
VLLTNCDELPAVLNDRQGFFCIRGSDLDRLEAGDFRAIEAWLADAAFIAPKKSPQPHQTEALDALLPALQTHDRVSAIMACGTGKTLVALWVAENVAQTIGSRGATDDNSPAFQRRVKSTNDLSPAGTTEVSKTKPSPDEDNNAPSVQPSRWDSLPMQPQPGVETPGYVSGCPVGTTAKILILLPSLALLRQTLHEWLRETRLPSLAYLCVCSDPTVKEGIDALATQQSDLDFQVSTDAASVRRFLDAPFAGVKMIFSTYQSASVVGAAMQPGDAFDFAVFDEAHKTAGREGRNFAFALDDKNLPIRKRLFMTATPRHYNPLAKDEEGEAQLVFSMDEPKVYGPQAYRLTFAEAARRGIICGYKVIISVITSEMVTNELLSRGEVMVNGDAVRARQVANQLALKDVVVKYKLKKVFTFHSRIEAAASFASNGNEGISAHLPEFKAFHVNGEMPTSLRERVMTEFRACARGVMSNARCLTEGVDVPAVDLVAFMSPRRSKIDIVQATGRAMRTAPGKTRGFVLVPLYVEQASGETVELAIQRGEFDEVWQVLQSLQEQDAILAETISQLREYRGRGTGFDDAAFRDQVDVLGPRICLELLRATITTQCADILGSIWDERLGQLKAFLAINGHLHVDAYQHLVRWGGTHGVEASGFPIPLDDDLRVIDSQVRQWAKIQRRLKLKGKLTDDQICKLSEIGFDWNPTREKTIWDIMLARLRIFKNHLGHCNLKHDPAGQYDLQAWLNEQNHKFNENQLTVGEIEDFTQLGVVFDPPESRETKQLKKQLKAWDKVFGLLLGYKKEHGDCDVPRNYNRIDNFGRRRLGWWVTFQRKLRSSGHLGSDFIRRLDEIGFIWDQQEYLWQKMYSSLCQQLNSGAFSGLDAFMQYKRKSNLELRKWVISQQSAKKRGVLSPQKELALEQIGFPCTKKRDNLPKPTWEDVYVKLAEFHKTYGHCDMKLVLPLNERLHKWSQKQRQAKQEGLITSDQIRQLDQLGFIWDTNQLLWERMLKILIEYKSIHGDCNVPRYWQQNFELAGWVWSQRKQRATGNLRKDRLERLESLDFEW